MLLPNLEQLLTTRLRKRIRLQHIGDRLKSGELAPSRTELRNWIRCCGRITPKALAEVRLQHDP